MPAQDVGVPLPKEVLQTPADILALIALLMVLFMSYRFLEQVVIPLFKARATAKPAATEQLTAVGQVDAWLTITRELVEQIKRSVDSQIATTAAIDNLAKNMTTEIHQAEARVVADLKATYAGKDGC